MAHTPDHPATTVQTLIMSKTVFKTAQAARKWARDHKFKTTKMDETGTSFRFRQREPGDFKPRSFRTTSIARGVSIVIGRLK